MNIKDIIELPDYAGESNIHDLYEIATQVYSGQGDPIYALLSRKMRSPMRGELEALLKELKNVVAGKYSQYEEWNLEDETPAEYAAASWVKTITKLLNPPSALPKSGAHKLVAISEQEIAKKMQGQGYQYILIREDGHMPLYSKTMTGVTELLRTDLKDIRVDVRRISDFIS